MIYSNKSNQSGIVSTITNVFTSRRNRTRDLNTHRIKNKMFTSTVSTAKAFAITLCMVSLASASRPACQISEIQFKSHADLKEFIKSQPSGNRSTWADQKRDDWQEKLDTMRKIKCAGVFDVKPYLVTNVYLENSPQALNLCHKCIKELKEFNANKSDKYKIKSKPDEERINAAEEAVDVLGPYIHYNRFSPLLTLQDEGEEEEEVEEVKHKVT
jgi:hypothetical protein